MSLSGCSVDWVPVTGTDSTQPSPVSEAAGAVNEAVNHQRLEEVALEYATDIAAQSPQAVRMLKFAFNAVDDGLAGQQVFAGEATRMGYMTDEAVEGRDAFLAKRTPNWSNYPYYY